MRLAVCEAPAVLEPGAAGWRALGEAVRNAAPDCLLLNEMPFGPWIAAGPEADAEALAACHRAHVLGVERLAELGAPVVLGTHATRRHGRSVNEAFVWEPERGLLPAHTKQFFPDEDGYFEARWFQRGETHFRPVRVPAPGVADSDLLVGFLICTEVWFNEWARRYGRSGAHLIAVPRATPAGSTDRWRTAVRMAAMVSGCYVASSNRSGADEGGGRFAGRGWIVDPSGVVIAETSPSRPLAVAELDLSVVERAKREYPCYVEDLPPSATEDGTSSSFPVPTS